MGVYVHWPFCRSKCPYCDFNAHVRESIDEAAWADAYVKALGHYAELLPKGEVASIFFGGGTPSLMSPQTVERIIYAVQKNWRVANDIEITLEANPTSIESEKLEGFKLAGVNRVSMGVQALNDADLKFLGREHSANEALKAVETAANIFDRYSFDLMYARPNQTLDSWREELERALPHTNGHMSLYQLTIERNTPFYMDHAQGKFKMPEEELASDFYTMTQEILEQAGMPAYEVSNHAAAGQESEHNKIYWRYGDYVGVGPGAHGRLRLAEGKVATREHSAPDIWLERVQENGCGYHPFSVLAPRDQFAEGLMMGMRLKEGLDLKALADRTGVELSDALAHDKITTLVNEGWLSLDGTHLKLTQEGWLRLNAILPYILS